MKIYWWFGWRKEVKLNLISLYKRQNNVKSYKDKLDLKPKNADEAAKFMNTAFMRL